MRAALLTATALLGGWLATAQPTAAAEGLAFPAPAGTRWSIAAGYNTATHLGTDPYAIDVVRDDAETAGTAVFAPTDGTLSISTNCLTIRDASRVAVLLCHIFPEAGLRASQRVVRGQRIGVVAPAGAAGNNGLAHIHIAAHFSTTARGFGDTIPLAGMYALEGVQLPATLQDNAHGGVAFASTNVEAAAAPSTALAAVTPKTTPTAAATPAPPPGSLASVLGLRSTGVSLGVVLTASAPADLSAATRAAGATRSCTYSSVVNGNWITYVDGAPAAVNERWRAIYPTTLPANTTLYFVCDEPASPSGRPASGVSLGGIAGPAVSPGAITSPTRNAHTASVQRCSRAGWRARPRRGSPRNT